MVGYLFILPFPFFCVPGVNFTLYLMKSDANDIKQYTEW